MDKKKILIVSRAFYPIIAPRSFRATELAKEFALQGHDVTVLTHKRDFDYTEFSTTYNVKIEDFVNGKWKEITGNSIIIKGLRFFLNYFLLYPDIQLTPLVKKALKNKSAYDLLVSIAVPYPVHWGVALAQKTNENLCKVWVADCGDPFMGNKENKFKNPFYFRLVENWFCKKPDYITVPIKEAIEAYPSFCRGKIKVIPQGFNFEEVNTPDARVENPYPYFAYAGNLSKDIRDPSKFLEYLCTKNDKKFKFIIYTKSLSVVEPYKHRLGYKLEIRDYVPRERLLDDLGNMDFLVNIENTNHVQSPSKLIDYALTGKPVLSIKPHNLNTQIVDEFMNGNYANQRLIEDIDQYDIKNVAKQFISLTPY
ncbi:MAG TPA: glycosyltransferase [Paludibacter sp.]|nr:glycosyltransferase [Paludibacter sp.]